MTATGKSLVLTILSTGLLVGLLDGLAAIVQYSINGSTKPASIFKYIASAVFGKEAFKPAAAMIMWGVFFHLLTALLFTAFFYIILAPISWVRTNWLVAGVLYGTVIWMIMSQLVIPLSTLGPTTFQLKNAVIAILILIFCIEIPVSYSLQGFTTTG